MKKQVWNKNSLKIFVVWKSKFKRKTSSCAFKNKV